MNIAVVRKDKKPLFTVYAKVANMGFSATMLIDGEETDKDGNVTKVRKPIQKMNTHGGPLVINKKLQYEEEMWTFLTTRRSTIDGSHSIFPVYEDTPDYVQEALKKMADDSRQVDIIYEDTYQQDKNPQAYAEKKRREALESELKSANEKAEVATGEAKFAKNLVAGKDKVIEKMQKKLEKYETKEK